MRRVVWKYTADPTDGPMFEREMPGASPFLHLALQHGALSMWFLVNPEVPRVLRRFRIVGTGHAEVAPNAAYRGTFLTDGGEFVFHVFEEPVS